MSFVLFVKPYNGYIAEKQVSLLTIDITKNIELAKRFKTKSSGVKASGIYKKDFRHVENYYKKIADELEFVEINEDLKEFQDRINDLKSDPALLKKILIKTGIIDTEGNVTLEYGGKL